MEEAVRTFVPFQTPVRGHGFAATPRGARPPGPGQPAWLARERANPRDGWAIAVWVQDPTTGASWRIGYLDRAVGARLSPRLDQGMRVNATISDWWEAPGGRWQRPVVALRPAEAPRRAA